MENEPRKIINHRNFYPDPNFLESFNKKSIEIKTSIGISEIILDDTLKCAKKFHELAILVINQFKSVEDIEDDEFLESFKNLNFLSKPLKKSPYGDLLNEDIITEISSYLIRAKENAKRSKDSNIKSKISLSMADLDVIRGHYWNALNNYTRAILIAKKYNLKELYYESQILLGIFYVYIFWRSDFVHPIKKTKIMNAGIKILETTEEKLRNSNYLEIKAICYGELANIFEQRENYHTSEEYYLNAIELSGRVNSFNIKQKYCFEIAKLYEDQKKFDEAINFMEKSKDIAWRLGNEIKLANCITDLSRLYEKIGNIAESVKLMMEAEEVFGRIYQ